MHTIIINTMGSELRQNQLFYLPFRADRFHWIEKSLTEIAQCPEEIAAYHSDQGQRQDYHVVLLVSIAQLRFVELKSVRQIYTQLLRGYLNEQFLHPLCQNTQLPPTGVSIVFMLREKTDGQGNVEVGRELDRIFGFTEELQELTELTLKNKDGNAVLDMKPLFSDAIDGYHASLEKQRLEPMVGAHYALEQLRRHLGERITSLQECSYIPIGKEHTVTLNCQSVEFAPLTTDWDLCCLDMQLNLSEHLQAHLNSDTVWQLNLVPHDAQTLRRRIQLAILRVQCLQENSHHLAYFEFQESASGQTTQDITGEIWSQLMANTQIPGVEEAKLETETLRPEEAEVRQKGQGGLGKKLRKTWLLIGLEKKRFTEQCRILEQQYAPEEVNKQQKDVLDICAKVFGQWRSQILRSRGKLPAEATATEMPVFDGEEYEKKLDEAQRKWGAATVRQLEDYEDVRQQAEQIKADFRKTYRLWPDGEFNATTKFCIYSLVLALLFLLQMMLPYVGITMGQEGVQISRYVHFLLSLGTFVVLYAAGVLIWMRALCKRMHRYTRAMHDLLSDSHRRRRQSIAQAVEIYGSVLPQCTYSYEQLQRMREINEMNLQRKERYNAHMHLLSKAEELLYELQTQLRMYSDEKLDKPKLVGGIDYEKPPSDGENVRFYVFMSEKWGRM
jgi:hypothetical protein